MFGEAPSKRAGTCKKESTNVCASVSRFQLCVRVFVSVCLVAINHTYRVSFLATHNLIKIELKLITKEIEAVINPEHTHAHAHAPDSMFENQTMKL